MSDERLVPAIGRSLRRAIILVSLIQVFVFYLVASSLFSQLPQLGYRDTAAFVANYFQVALDDGYPEAEALIRVTREVEEYIPQSALLFISENGDVLSASGRCSLISTRVPPASLLGYRGPELPPFPVPHRSVCAEGEERLSGAAVRVGDSLRYLLVVKSGRSISRYLRSAPGAFHFLEWTLIAPAFLGVWAIACFELFRRLLLRHARALAERAKRFGAGDLSVRFDPGEFPEYEQLANTFNNLAAEISARIAFLRKDDEDRRALMAGLAHDLRTPITAIDGCIELLSDESRAETRRADYVSLIKTSASTEEELALNLDQLATLSSSEQLHELDDIDVSEASRAAISLAAPIAELKGVALRFEVEPSIAARGNAALLRRALLNLCDNAIRHTPTGGSVTVAVRRAGDDSVSLEVSDSGHGIADVERSRLFDRMSEGGRSEAARSIHTARGGLGLTIVRYIVELHGGSIHVDSGAERGTSIRLLLPCSVSIARRAGEKDAIREVSPAPRAVSLRLTEAGQALTSMWAAAFAVWSGPSLLRFALAFPIILFQVTARRSTSAEEKVQLHTLSLFLLVTLTAVETHPPVIVLIGFAIALAFMHLCRTLPRRRIAIPLLFPICFVFPRLFLPSASMFALGVICGLMLCAALWPMDALSRARRAGVWFASLILVGIGSSLGFQTFGMYQFALRAQREVATQEGPHVWRSLRDQLYNGSAYPLPSIHFPISDSERIGAFLVHAYAVNPMYDYAFHVHDELVAASGEAEGSVRLKRVNRHVESNSAWLDTPRTIELSHRVRALLGRICPDRSCPTVTLIGPSAIFDAIIHRTMNDMFYLPFFSQFAFALLLFRYLGQDWLRRIEARVCTLRQGLDRYARGDYRTPIADTSSDDIAALATELDAMAIRIPELEATIEAGRRSRRAFLRAAADEILRAARSVSAALRRYEDNHSTLSELAKSSASLREIIESFFELASGQRRGDSAPLETFSLADAILEEVDLRASAAQSPIGLVTSEDPCLVQAAVDTTVQTVRIMLDAAVRSADLGERISATLERDGASVVFTVAYRGQPLDSAQIEYLRAPLGDNSLEMRAAPLPEALSGFMIASLSSRLSRFGGSLSIESSGTDRILWRLTLPAMGEGDDQQTSATSSEGTR